MLIRNPFSNRNRKVRIHLQGGTVLTDGGPPVQQSDLTIEGVLAGETRRHYIIWAPKVMDRPKGDSSDVEAVDLSGHVEIPRERVIFFQVIG
jgi:hypothetical protein